MYGSIHSIVCLCWRWFAVFPFGTLFFAVWYMLFPVSVLYGLIACEDSGSFRHMLKDLYIDLPRNFFGWCVFG